MARKAEQLAEDVRFLLFSDTEQEFDTNLKALKDIWPINFHRYFMSRLEKDVRISAKFSVIKLGIFDNGVSRAD